MKRSEMLEVMALDIAKQAVEKGQVDIDLSWLDTSRLLSLIEEAGMNPPFFAPDDMGLVWGDEESGEPNGFKVMVSKWDLEKMEKEIEDFFKETDFNKDET